MSDAAFYFTIAAVCFAGSLLLKLKITKTRHSPHRRRIGLLHGPGPVLKDDASWRTLNGFYITVGDSTHWIEVR